MKIEIGEIIIIVLRDPREKVIGILHEINAAGVFVRGIDLNYFDEWASAIRNDEQFLPMQDYFYPMWRVERITKDESGFGTISMREQFFKRTGLNLEDF